MKFKRLPSIFQGQEIWGCVRGSFTFIITKDRGKFSASTKVYGSSAFDGSRHDLGGFGAHNSFEEAANACKSFYRNRN
jgi:hypothetical protein